jgi:protein ImuB
MVDGLSELGYRAHTAAAPTPLGAWLLCRAGRSHPVTNHTALIQALHSLPVEVLVEFESEANAAAQGRSGKAQPHPGPQHIPATLRGMGLHSLGDCLRLPRDGLARRLGPGFVRCLDRALGKVPDPRTAFKSPPRFESRLTLPSEVTDTAALLFAARRLVLELAGFLLARSRGVQEVRLALYPYKGSPDYLILGLISPSRDPDHLLKLLRQRLEQYELSNPVDALELSADRLVPLNPSDRHLFVETSPDKQDWPQLMETLQARLGRDAVRGLCPRSDHRPERAWRYGFPGESKNTAISAPRPLWLLKEPAALDTVQNQPWLDGRLVLEHRPERIESGWWDGTDIARDYYVAESPRHERFWIFRELRPPHRWFLHGIFG